MLVNGYPNTYTYSKSLSERYLERYRGKVRIVINRPTMVASCFKEPLRGWIDTITAVGVAGYPLGMGYQRMIYMPNPIIDFIPGDLCSNSILVSTAYIASLQ